MASLGRCSFMMPQPDVWQKPVVPASVHSSAGVAVGLRNTSPRLGVQSKQPGHLSGLFRVTADSTPAKREAAVSRQLKSLHQRDERRICNPQGRSYSRRLAYGFQSLAIQGISQYNDSKYVMSEVTRNAFQAEYNVYLQHAGF